VPKAGWYASMSRTRSSCSPPRPTADTSMRQFRRSSTVKGTSLVAFELTRFECAKYVVLAASSAYACVIAMLPTCIAHHMEMSLLFYKKNHFRILTVYSRGKLIKVCFSCSKQVGLCQEAKHDNISHLTLRYNKKRCMLVVW
jgi:hypothetical protein